LKGREGGGAKAPKFFQNSFLPLTKLLKYIYFCFPPKKKKKNYEFRHVKKRERILDILNSNTQEV
jgi:hypothetical protein